MAERVAHAGADRAAQRAGPHGLTLQDIAIENTVFRVLSADSESLTVGLYHIWNPNDDPSPELRQGVTVFHPRFASRRCERKPAPMAQQEAISAIERALASYPPALDRLQSLGWDSGAAVDMLIKEICQPLEVSDLDPQIQRVLFEAERRISPLAAFGLNAKLSEAQTFEDRLTLAYECGVAGRKPNAVPDFLAWELYLAGATLQRLAAALLEQKRREPYRQPASYFDEADLNQMAEADPWSLLTQVATGRYGKTIDELLHALSYSPGLPRLEESYRRLSIADKDYARRCVEGGGLPPPSHRLVTEYAPGCFTSWDRVCYDIAAGDTALAVAWAIRPSVETINTRLVRMQLDKLKHVTIARTFSDLADRHATIVRDVEQKLTAGDPTSIGLAAAALHQAHLEIRSYAEGLYIQAARSEEASGCGWIRLARLQWLDGRYRTALETLIGPRAEPERGACQLSLAVAVHGAGGRMVFDRMSKWSGIENATIELVRSGNDLLLSCMTGRTSGGRCRITGLAETDVALLAAFFSKYTPDMLSGTAAASFETWLCQVPVPNLGHRAQIAATLDDEARFALLTAAVYLGVPPVVGRLPDGSAKPRPAEWLEQDVVTHIEWR